MDKTSLNLAPKSLALEMAQFYTDLYMRRAFLSSVLPFRPDIILFLGDYFDGGPFLSDEEWVLIIVSDSWSSLLHMNIDIMFQSLPVIHCHFKDGKQLRKEWKKHDASSNYAQDLQMCHPLTYVWNFEVDIFFQLILTPPFSQNTHTHKHLLYFVFSVILNFSSSTSTCTSFI